MIEALLTLQDHIGRLIGEGATVEHVEEMIDRSGLSPEQKDALWLYAWAMQSRRGAPPLSSGVERRASALPFPSSSGR